MGDVGVQVCCVGMIGVGACFDRKNMDVGGPGGVGGVSVQGLDVGIGGSGVGVVGVDVGVVGVGAGDGLSRRVSVSLWPSMCKPFIVSHVLFGHGVGCPGWPRRTSIRSWASRSSGLRALRRVWLRLH